MGLEIGPDDFYAVQSAISAQFKLGRSRAGLVIERGLSHDTALGPIRLIGVATNVPRDFESSVFRDLRAHLATAPGRRRSFEVCPFHTKVARYLCSKAFRELGFRLMRRPFNPYTETCRQWLERVRDFVANSEAAAAAAHNLRMDDEVKRVANGGSNREGWTLAHSVSGGLGFVPRRVRVERNLSMFLEPGALDRHNRLISTLRLPGGRSVTFFVFAEAMRRFGAIPSEQAIETGIPWLRESISVGIRRRASTVGVAPSDSRQILLVP